jgi:putative RecB family exonuclease
MPTDQTPPRAEPGEPAGTDQQADTDVRADTAAPTSLSTLSPSRASDFKTCPQLFKFRAIDRLEEPTTIYQARGTTAHLALERLFDLSADQRTADRLYDLFREAWTELRGDVEFAELFESIDEERAWGLESMEVLANYFALEDPSRVQPFDRELDMLETLGDITIRGILDRIDEDADGELIITDYKTGKAPPERYALPAFFALKIYALLIRTKLGRTPKALRLLYMGNATMYTVAVDDQQLDAMRRQLEALWKAINRALERGQFPPKVGPLCNWCAFQDRCPAFVEADEGSGQLRISASA